MKINIIADEESGWILYKFAKAVYDELSKLGFEVKLSYEYDSSCDINHYFVPANLESSKKTIVDDHTSFMITHVDTQLKIDEIKRFTEKGAIGICMSKETRDRLISNGVKSNKICYINPAQDGQIVPRKIKLGITHRVYNDCRKRDEMVVDVCKHINPKLFKWVIMGSGWEEIIGKLENLGFEVEYYKDFDKQKYNELIVNLDYYCYFGTDEGSMGYLDALAAGIGTIITPQGYHLDGGCEITYPVNTVHDIVKALEDIESKVVLRQGNVNEWTWENYTLKHIEIWKYMLRCETLDELLKNRGNYVDGIFSIVVDDLFNYVSIKDYLSKK